MEKSIRVLLIDDDSDDVTLSRRALAAIGEPRFVVETAASLGEAIQRIRDSVFEIVLLDLGLPDCPRLETLAQFRQACGEDIPVIVLTGLADDRTALEALDCGAQDYICKDEVTPDTLSRSIRYSLMRQNLLLQLKATNNLLEQKNRRLAQLCDTAQQFVENVSHEFRTPLTVIREFTSIICDGIDGPVTAKQVEHLNKVLHRTDDLALMVDDMLDISKLEAGLLGVWRTKCNVNDLIDNVVGLLKGRAASKTVALRVKSSPDLPAVFCDEEKARRVIMNLAVNAIKFAPSGGTVEVWARPSGCGPDVEIGVTDNGPGISRENLEIIFERFRQVDQGLASSTKGFGLGLNIAKELVALNLGQIHVESSPGSGSTFWFTVPPFDPRIVLERYLERDVRTSGAPPDVSLLAAELALPKDEAAVVVDEFLQRSIRPTDLVMPAGSSRWTIAAACSAGDSERLAERLTSEWQDYARNFPQVKLPPLQIHYRATWPAGERQALVQEFIDSYDGEEENPRAMPTVLVVDDDREVSQCLAVRLRSAGFRVVSACDGEEGLTSARSHHPDAIVLDVRMPKKDGLTVLKELRGYPPTKDIPIIMLSASIHDQQNALRAGASYFVRKPYEADEVLSAIESSIGEAVS